MSCAGVYSNLKNYEKRLAVIKESDPQFAIEIETFLRNNKEFEPFKYLIPVTRYPRGFGIYQLEGDKGHPQDPANFIEWLLHYICEAGVNSKYARKQWEAMIDFLRSTDYDLLSMLEIIPNIQPKKRATYTELALYMIKNEITTIQLGIEHMLELEKNITGIGESCVAFMSGMFAKDYGANKVEATDRGFVSGFIKLYGLRVKPTHKQIIEKISGWGEYKRIGSLMCCQIFHYAK